MIIRQYKFKVNHDNGSINITIASTSKSNAIKSLCKYEGCPDRAVELIDINDYKTKQRGIKC